MKANWGMTLIRGLFASLNYCIYSLFEFIMQGIFDIANLKLTEGLIGDVYNRIYVFLAIFMVFKLTLSLLTYMVSPDKLTDKEKGVGKLVGRTITMLALVLLLPSFFPLLNEAQTAFLPVLPKVILGQDTDNSNTVSDNAQVLASSALGAFYTPCSSCDESDRPSAITSVAEMMDTYDDKVNGIYAYDFNFISALVVGIVIVIILVTITVNIGIRMFKMFLLELIAPIPIMSYIDPKSSKDGAFASWTKQLLSTFIDIFIRLGVVYIVLLLMSALADGNLLDPTTMPTNPVRKTYLMVFLIIALLMFAKDAPNFVKDALGIKHSKEPNAALAGITGAATGAVSGAISGRGWRGAITGAVSGAGASYQGAKAGKSVSGWSAAGDAALQARTGDPKAKSGILAALQSSASKAQLAREGRKLNITEDSIEAAKSNKFYMQDMANRAADNLAYGMQTGNFYDMQGHLLEDDENGTAYEKAQQIRDEWASLSGIASSNYDKMNKAGDSYRINRSFPEDLKHDRKEARKAYLRGEIDRPTYRASGKANPNKGHREVDGGDR